MAFVRMRFFDWCIHYQKRKKSTNERERESKRMINIPRRNEENNGEKNIASER